MKGLVFDIQKFSLHDGPGIRTTVFLKGCSLRCFWCQNPEGLSSKQELQYLESQCINCGMCFSVCPVGAHTIRDGIHEIDRDKCTLCGECVKACPAKALQFTAREMEAREIVEQVLNDKIYYDLSGGGITLSGGEPLVQADFSSEILRLCKSNGIHTAIETAFNVEWSEVEKVLPNLDLIMADIKAVDTEIHKHGTGVNNKRILENLQRIAKQDIPLIVRVPLMPGVNDSDEDISNIAQLVKNFPNLRYLELVPFHRLGESKYRSIGLIPKTEHLSYIPDERLREIRSLLLNLNIKVKG